MFCYLHNAIQLLFALLVLKKNKAQLFCVLSLSAEGWEPFARPTLTCRQQVATALFPCSDAKNKQEEIASSLLPLCTPNSGANSQNHSPVTHGRSFPCICHEGIQHSSIFFIYFFFPCPVGFGGIWPCSPRASGAALPRACPCTRLPGAAGCRIRLLAAGGVPRTDGRAVAAEQRALAGGRQSARRWKGKLGHISGLKSLDGVPFILDFS